MEKEFVPYQESLELKELGFDEECFSFYSPDGYLYQSEGYYKYQENVFGLEIIAPTFSQAFRWFREKHNLFSTIEIDQTMEPKYCYSISGYEPIGNWENIVYGSEMGLYYTYEEAELECLRKLIEIVKNK